MLTLLPTSCDVCDLARGACGALYRKQHVSDLYFNDSGISHSFDYFETGCGGGPGTWGSLSAHTTRNLKRQLGRSRRATWLWFSAVQPWSYPCQTVVLDAVVTDPPYDAMINYCDSSDLMYVWLKRALVTAHPWLA